MTWVVKDWRMDGLERLLTDEARASVRAARDATERDARRVRRVADRTARDAAAELEALERLAGELRANVRRARGTAEATPEREASQSGPAPLSVAPAGRRRNGRASMRSSALSELFRATSVG